MAAKKGSGFASRTQPNGAQKQGSPRIAKNPHPQKPRVGHPQISPKEWGRHSVDLESTKNKAASSRRTPKEQREWERAVEKKNEKRRNKYQAVHGKVVDWVDHWIEEGWLFVGIRFKDKTHFWLQFGAKIVTDEIDLCDVRSGSLRLVREYFRRRDL